jgi:hypothetical protein
VDKRALSWLLTAGGDPVKKRPVPSQSATLFVIFRATSNSPPFPLCAQRDKDSTDPWIRTKQSRAL